MKFRKIFIKNANFQFNKIAFKTPATGRVKELPIPFNNSQTIFLAAYDLLKR